LLSVSAREEATGVESSVQVKPSYGLSDGEIERMLIDSIEHAEDDVAARLLREQQVEADRVLEAVIGALAQDGDLLDASERAAIDEAVAALRTASEGSEPRGIKRAIEELEEASAVFVARRMDASIKQALAGHSVEEFN
jgi:molecular chaperone HscA